MRSIDVACVAFVVALIASPARAQLRGEIVVSGLNPARRTVNGQFDTVQVVRVTVR